MIPTNYDPRTSEEKWYQYWLEHRFFHSTVDKKRTPYCIVIPPPNVTGVLHMGHMLNNTIQDVLSDAPVYSVKTLVGFREPTMPPLPRKPKW